MGKRTSPVGYRLGVTFFWESPVVFQNQLYAIKNRINLICLQLVTNLFYREKLYISKLGIQTVSLVNIVISLEYFLPLTKYRVNVTTNNKWFKPKRTRRKKRISPVLVTSPQYIVRIRRELDITQTSSLKNCYYWQTLMIKRYGLKIMKSWKKKNLNGIRVIFPRKVKSRIRFLLRKKHVSRYFRQIYSYSIPLSLSRKSKYKYKESLQRQSININRLQRFFCKLVELRLKNFLENFLTIILTHHVKFLFYNLATIFQIRTARRKWIQNVFEQVRTQLLMDTLNKKDGHQIFWYVSGLVICGCYFTSSTLMLMWLTLKLSRLRKFDLYYTQTKLIALFFTVIKNVFHLLNTIKGVRLEVYGKLNGKMRASARTFKLGYQIQKQGLCANIEYNVQEAYTYGGVLNCKLWLLKSN